MVNILKRFVVKGLQKSARVMGLNEIATRQDLILTRQQELADRQTQITVELEKLRKFCNSLEYQIAVAPDGLPIPPQELHRLVGSFDLTVSEFFLIGTGFAEEIKRIISTQNLALDDFENILEFGCGCGRAIRHFHLLQKAKVYGTDYNPVLVDWCKENLPFAEFNLNGLYPPLQYNNIKFDFVYTLSVFTHLYEQLQFLWMAEILRVMKPGGYFLLTTMGPEYAREHLSPEKLELFNSGQLVVENEKEAGKNECLVFHPLSFVKEILAKEFEICYFKEGEIVNHERRFINLDYYLLRKPV